jgi:hypothetical protein
MCGLAAVFRYGGSLVVYNGRLLLPQSGLGDAPQNSGSRNLRGTRRILDHRSDRRGR